MVPIPRVKQQTSKNKKPEEINNAFILSKRLQLQFSTYIKLVYLYLVYTCNTGLQPIFNCTAMGIYRHKLLSYIVTIVRLV